MLKLLIKLLWTLIILSIVALIASRFLNIEFGNDNYWEYHGVLFLIGLAAFPRLTLLFSSVISGGFFWWLAWLFAPRILVAVLATLAYWQQNPVLVAFSWLVAIGGESSEKYIVVRRSRMRRPRQERAVNRDVIDITANRRD